jgi:hypothetical protein
MTAIRPPAQEVVFVRVKTALPALEAPPSPRWRTPQLGRPLAR